jgi:ATP-dependent DNA ligase
MLQRSGSLVGFIEPCPPSPAKATPSGLDWLDEIKHDGFRLMTRREVFAASSDAAPRPIQRRRPD